MISVGLAQGLVSRLEKPLGAICEGRVGADGIDRSGYDWLGMAATGTLLEFCGLVGTLWSTRTGL